MSQKLLNIPSGTALDAILRDCDPDNIRGTCATGIACIAGLLLKRQSAVCDGAPVTACNDHIFVGAPGSGKSRVIAALEAVAGALDVPCIMEWPKSFDAGLEMIHEALQRRKDDAPDGTPQFETVHKELLIVLDEQGALLQAQGRGDAAAMAVAGVQTLINMTASGVVTNTRAVTRKPTKWPKLEGVTVIWARFAQVKNGAAMIAATRAGESGTERRQAIWTVEAVIPRDAQGAPLRPDCAAYNLERAKLRRRCFDVAQLKHDMDAAQKAALKGAVPVQVIDSANDAVAAAIEAAAHGDEDWSNAGQARAYLLAQDFATTRAYARGSTATDDNDWLYAAAMVDLIHSTAEASLELQDSATDQQLALREVQQRFARAPYIDSADEPRSMHRLGSTTIWIGRKQLRLWALCVWGLQNLVLLPGRAGGKHDKCFYRRHKPVEAPVDIPRDVTMMDFLRELHAIQTARMEDVSAFPSLPPT